MRKLVLFVFLIFIINSCATQKYYSDNGKRISKKTFTSFQEQKLKYILENMSNDDLEVLKTITLTNRVKDSLIRTYYNY